MDELQTRIESFILGWQPKGLEKLQQTIKLKGQKEALATVLWHIYLSWQGCYKHCQYETVIALIKDFITLGENDNLQGLTGKLLLSRAINIFIHFDVPSGLQQEAIQALVHSGITIKHLDPRLYKKIIKGGHLMGILQVLLAECPQSHIDGLDDTQPNCTPLSPLHWAVWYRQLDIIHFLVSKGFSVNDKCMTYHSYEREHHHCRLLNTVPGCVTPLHYAAELNDFEMTSLLLELGADIYALVDSSQLPFCIAMENGNTDLAVRKLLPTNINAPDPRGKKNAGHNLWPSYDIPITGTILHYACCTTSVASVKKLIELGADPTIVADGYLPIQLAILTGQYNTAEYLFPMSHLCLEHWTKRQLQMAYDTYFCPMNGPGHTVPHIGDQKLFMYLINAGVKPPDPDYLYSAISGGPFFSFELVEMILECGCSPNEHGMSKATFSYILWDTIYLRANKSGLVKYVMAVLRANPDMTLTSRKVEKGARTLTYENGKVLKVDGTTAMQEALLSEDPEIITLCVESGCCLLNTKPMLDYVPADVKKALSSSIVELLECYNDTPRSLQHMAKFAVRRCLGHKHVNSKIDQLAIPRDMKRYLKDIGLEAAEMRNCQLSRAVDALSFYGH